jgi:hypothetical protein
LEDTTEVNDLVMRDTSPSAESLPGLVQHGERIPQRHTAATADPSVSRGLLEYRSSQVLSKPWLVAGA